MLPKISHKSLRIYLPKVYNPKRLEEIFELVKNDDGNIHRRLEHLVFKMFGEIADAHKKLKYDSSKASQARRFIDKRITTKITVSEVCEYLNINNAYFCRLFAKEYGISPIQYIIREKIEQSKYLLANSGISIEYIAMHYAFTNKSHYIRTFIAQTGISPGTYRKQNQENNP